MGEGGGVGAGVVGGGGVVGSRSAHDVFNRMWTSSRAMPPSSLFRLVASNTICKVKTYHGSVCLSDCAAQRFPNCGPGDMQVDLKVVKAGVAHLFRNIEQYVPLASFKTRYTRNVF